MFCKTRKHSNPIDDYDKFDNIIIINKRESRFKRWIRKLFYRNDSDNIIILPM